eukprot:TRINITY_DN541_c0_g3_i1.p1 TRINITY_DN541_c0_g3~~TRINITY_DN541_c0_g3_i1.p1  ORF type:complete len:597 (-),score=151.69 TRINITY_DN541_c0_g3_i1:40-1830(-)
MGLYTGCFKGLERLPLQLRLVVFVGGPLIAALIFAILLLNSSVQTTNSLLDVQTVVQIAIKIDEMTHELQKERGLTSSYMGDQSGAPALNAQRLLTDQKVTAFNAVFGPWNPAKYDNMDLLAAYDTVNLQLSVLSLHRASVNALAVTEHVAIEFYTTLIDATLNVVEHAGAETSAVSVQHALGRYVQLLHEKELCGLQRSGLLVLYQAQAITVTQMVAVTTLMAQESLWHQQFFTVSPARTREYYNAAVVTNGGKALFASAREDVLHGRFNMTAAEWFALATAHINSLKLVTVHQEEEITSLINSLISDARQATNTVLIILLVVLSVAISFGLAVSFSISRPFQRIALTLASVEVEIGERKKVAERAVASANNLRESLRLLEQKMQIQVDEKQLQEDTIPELMRVACCLATDAQFALAGLKDLQHSQSNVSMIEAITLRIDHVVDSIRTLTSNMYQTVEIELKPCALAEQARLAVEMVQSEFTKNDISLACDCRKPMRDIIADETQLYFVLQRLLVALAQMRGNVTAVEIDTARGSDRERVQLVVTSTCKNPQEVVSACDSNTTERLLRLMDAMIEVDTSPDRVKFYLTFSVEASQ